jgi:hypothetical protein
MKPENVPSTRRDAGIALDRKVEALPHDRSDVALIVRPMLIARRQMGADRCSTRRSVHW